MEQLLIQDDLVALESSEIISHEAQQMGENLYESTIEMLNEKFFVETEELIMQESDDEEGQFKEIDDQDDDFEYTTPEEEKKSMEYIPLDYKIKVVNMAKAHPKWNLATLQKKRWCMFKKYGAFIQMGRKY